MHAPWLAAWQEACCLKGHAPMPYPVRTQAYLLSCLNLCVQTFKDRIPGISWGARVMANLAGMSGFI